MVSSSGLAGGGDEELVATFCSRGGVFGRKLALLTKVGALLKKTGIKTGNFRGMLRGFPGSLREIVGLSGKLVALLMRIVGKMFSEEDRTAKSSGRR